MEGTRMSEGNEKAARRLEAGDGGAEATRYWWWKAPEDLFGRHEMMVLKAMKGGREMAEEYCEMCCRAVSRGGYLRFSKEKPYSRATLGSVIGLPAAGSSKLCKALEAVDLLEWLGDGTAHLAGLEDLIGSETEDARRKRASRAEGRPCPGGTASGQCPITEDTKKDNVRTTSKKKVTETGQCPDNVHPSPLGEPHNSESLEGMNTPSLRSVVSIPDEEEDTEGIHKGGVPHEKASPDGTQAGGDGSGAECPADAKGPEMAAAMADDFWEAYPKKANRGAVRRWFASREPRLSEFREMMAALEAFKGSDDWKKRGGRYIPLPVSWLEGERWEDRAAAPLPGFEPSRAALGADIRKTAELAKKEFGW
jgi:hypothetical protein